MGIQRQDEAADFTSDPITAPGVPSLYWANGTWDGALLELKITNPFGVESTVTGSEMTEDGQKTLNIPRGWEYKVKLSNCGPSTVLSFGVQ